MGIRTLFINLIFCFYCFSGYTQSFNFKRYTVDNGLPSSEVYQVVQDNKGFIWFATNEGVSRFDGYQFTNFTNDEGLPENTILEIFEDEINRLWFISISGKLSWFQDDSVYQYQFNDSIENFKVGRDFPIKNSFFVDSALNVYVGFYRRNLIHINSKGEITEFKSKTKNHQLIKFLNDSIFVYSSYLNTNPIQLEIENNKEHIIKKQLKKRFKGNRAKAMFYDGKILYSNDRTLFEIDTLGKINSYEFSNEIIWLSKDNQCILWIGLLKDGVVAYKDLNFKKPIYELLRGNSISSVINDFEGGYWFTTLENGVYYSPSLEIKSVTTKDGLYSNIINQLAVNKDKIYFGGDRLNIYEYDLDTIIGYRYQIERNPRECRIMQFIGDTLLVGNNDSGTQFIYENKIIHSTGSCFQKVIMRGKDSLLCFYRQHIKLIYKGVEKYFINLDGISNIYDAIQVNNALIWIGTDKGLYEFNIYSQKIRKIDWHNVFNNKVISLLKDGNDIWVGTKGAGLFKINDKKVTRLSISEGISGNSVYSIIKEDSIIWLGTNHGISKLTLDNSTDSLKDILFISSGHGLITNEIEEIKLFKDNIFVATRKGLSYFNKKFSSANSPIYITKYKVSDKEMPLMENYNLSHDQNYIEISFVGINYQRNKPLKYLYKLEGIDKAWKKTEENIVRFSMLPPGNYKFKVKCVNSYGKESIYPASLSFKINKAYYQTVLFKIGLVVSLITLISLILLFIFRLKLRELKKRNRLEMELNKFRQRALSAQMNPHFIYNSLNSAQNYILSNDVLKSSEYLSMFGNLMRRVLNNSQSSSISLKEELEALKLYIDLELIRFQDAFQYNLYVSEDINLEKIKVPPLIMQPFVENAIHHGLRLKKDNKQLKINIFRKNNLINIHIEDNGVGRENTLRKNKEHRSYGTEITNKRLKIYSDLYKNEIKVNIVDLNNSGNTSTGTRIEIEFTGL